jgi:hypothetical protein
MRNERYQLEASFDAMTFEFTSVGPKGEIPKLVIYSKTSTKNVYNLAFGDKDPITGDIDDLIVTDNKDSQKVLATVASTLYKFIEHYPKSWVGAEGSTKARTRLYQISISKYLDEITEDFIVLGYRDQKWVKFEKNVQYDTFVITHKKNTI